MLKGLKDDFLSDSEEGGSEWGGGGGGATGGLWVKIK